MTYLFKFVILIALTLSTMQSNIIFDFNPTSNIQNWSITNDGVMGGKSFGHFDLNVEGNGVFSGDISLENNGGFSMLRYNFEPMSVQKFSTIVLSIKGDNKAYQFRIKADNEDYFSYVYPIYATEEWQEIEIPINQMYPWFRGIKLDKPNFNAESIEEIAFLIANKKAEHFQLLIDNIKLR